MKKLKAEFEERMKKMLGAEYDEFYRAFCENPIYSGIRINTLKEDAEKTVLEKFGILKSVEWCSSGFYADKSQISGRHPLHMAGLFYFQEPSAMSAVEALPVDKGDFVLDLCAAPGGKSTQAAAKLNGSGLLIANEIIKKRADILSENIERMGIKNAVVTNETPQKLAEKYEGFFDKVIVDAPCSGEGMFRKEPQAVTEWSIEHTVSCGERQKRILDCAVEALKDGGKLIYSTCTFAPLENEEIAAYLIKEHGMKLLETGLDMLDKGRSEWSVSGLDMTKTRRIFPHHQKGEGHFLALFEKPAKNGERPAGKAGKSGKKKNDGVLDTAVGLYRKFEKENLNLELDGCFRLFGDNLYLLPLEPDIDKIKVLRFGLHLGICKKNRFEPSHALCLALTKADFKSAVDLECESEVLKNYLTGAVINCGKNGWTAVCAEGFPIGWGKASGGALKNHYPKGLRLNI